MHAVIFEVYPTKEGTDEYLDIAGKLKPMLSNIDGFISIERFTSLNEEGKVLSLSFWENEEAIKQWRNILEHRSAQAKGHFELFKKYRIRVAKVERDYTADKREEAPADSTEALMEHKL